MSYRENETEGLNERIGALESKLNKIEMSGDQKMVVKTTSRIVAGILLLTTILCATGLSCNRADNSARIEASKICPAIAYENAKEAGQHR